MTRLALLTLSHAFMDCMLNVIPPLIPFFARVHGWSLAQLGAIAMMVSLSSGLLQPVLGAVVDRIGAGRAFPWTLLWVGAFGGLAGWAPSYPLLLVCVFLLGIGGALFHPLAAVIVPQAAERLSAAKATAMSVFSTGGSLGIAAAPLAFTYLATAFGTRGALWAFVPAALLTLLNVAAGTGKIAQGAAALRAPETPAEPAPADRPLALVWLCSGLTLRLVVYAALIAFLPLVFVERGYSEAQAGALLTGFLFTGSAGSILGGRLSDILGRRVVTVYSAFLIVPGLAGFLLARGPLSLLSLGFASLMMFATFSAVVIYAQELLPSRKAQAAGLVMGFVWAVASLTTPAIGAVADRLGLEETLWWLAWVPAAAGALMLLVPETLPKRLARQGRISA